MIQELRDASLWFLRFMNWKRELVPVVCITLISSFAFLIDAFGRKELLDSISIGSLSFLIQTLLIVFSLYAIASLIYSIRYRLTEGLNRSTEMKLREYYYDKIHTLSFRKVQSMNSEDIVARYFEDLEKISLFSSSALVNIVELFTSGIIAIVVLSTVSWPIALVTLAIGMVALLLTVNASRRVGIVRQQQVNASIKTESTAMDLLAGRKTFISFRRVTWGIERYSGMRQHLSNINANYERLQYLSNQFPILLKQFLGIVAAIYAVYLIYLGEGTIGLILAFQVLVEKGFQPFVTIVNMRIQFKDIQVSLNRIRDLEHEFLEQKSSSQSYIPVESSNEIEFIDVSMREGMHIFWGPNNISIKQGEKILLSGASGSGKSTFCRLLSGIYEQDEGEIRFKGVPLQEWDGDVRNRLIGYVPQLPYFTCERVDHLIEPSHYELIRDIPPDALIEQLSEGQKQKIAFERCLSYNPEVLILDEFVASIDERTRHHIYEILKRYQGTVILANHHIDRLDWVDKIIHFTNGKATQRKPMYSRSEEDIPSCEVQSI